MEVKHLFDIPENGVHKKSLEEQIRAHDNTAKVTVLGSSKSIRILCKKETESSTLQTVINSHDSSTALIEAIENKKNEIDLFSEERIHGRFDYNGSNFNGGFESQFRILAKLQDAIEFNGAKAAEDDEYEILWVARPAPVNLNEQNFRDLKYLLEVRVTEEVFRGAAAKATLAADCSTVQDVIDWDIEENY